MATTLPENQRARYLARSEADPGLVQNWIALTRPNIRAGIPIFQVWTAMARVPETRFEQQAPRVLENLLHGDRQPGRGRGRGPLGEPPPELDQHVRKAFGGRPPERIEEVADVYARLLARTDPEWEAAMQPVWEAALFRLLPRPDQNQLRQLRSQSDLLELTEPGAPPRAHVLADAPKPADAPILIRGQAETPGQVVPRRFLEVLSGKDRRHFDEGSGRLELANAIASATNPLTARVIVNRVWQHHFGSGFVRTPDDLGNQSAPPTSGTDRLAREPIHRRWLVAEEASSSDPALGNLAAEQPQQLAFRGDRSVQRAALASEHQETRIRAVARLDTGNWWSAGSHDGRSSDRSGRRHALGPRPRGAWQRRQPVAAGSASIGVRIRRSRQS
jgi:hypothetical protein